MRPRSLDILLRPLSAVLIPFVAFALQWMFWPAIQPYVWFLFYPAVFFSSWLGGLYGGLAATATSVVLVWYAFIPRGNPLSLLSAGMFLVMGVLFSIFHERLRKANAQALQASEDRYKCTLDGMLEGCQLIGFDWKYVYINDAAARHGRRKREDFPGHTIMEMYPGVETTEMFAVLRRVMEQRTAERLKNEFAYPDGSRGWFELSIQPAAEGIFVLSNDITEHMRADEELRMSVHQWNSTFDAINDAISIMDGQGRILRMNKAMTDLVNEDPGEILNRPCWEVVHHTEDRVRDCPFVKVQKSLRRESMVLRHGTRWFHVLVDPILDQTGRLTGGVHIMTDITKHRRFEEKLRESESKFRSLAEQSLVGIYIIQDKTLKYVNPRFAEMFGYGAEEIVDRMGATDLAVPEDRHIIEQAVASQLGDGSVIHYEARGRKKSSDIIHAEIFGSRALYEGRAALIGIVLDITEKKKLESQLRQAQKMEAVGQLTSGIAHDFNNILSAIIGYASLLQMKKRADDPERSYLDQILAITDRAAGLTRSLLTFSRKQITNLQPVDINENIRRVKTLLLRVIGEDIDLRTELSPRDLVVNADAGQIEQVLMNLATNARDAMQHGGILSIETAIADGDEPVLEAAPGAPERFARISVTDTGTGIDEKTRERIFEPFFTTKDLGRGTGLGLSMVYGIIKQHNGYIHCYSEPRMGTTFKIYLPLLSAVEAAVQKKGKEETAEDELRGTETILVVEDDEILRELTKTTLEDFGYRVITAVDGKDGIERFQQHKDAIRLVLCDVIMPRMSGSEVRDAIEKKAPGTSVLFMSGYPADIMRQKSMLEEGAEVVLKPISPLALLKKVREKLDAK